MEHCRASVTSSRSLTIKIENHLALGIRVNAFSSRFFRARRKLLCRLNLALEISEAALKGNEDHI